MKTLVSLLFGCLSLDITLAIMFILEPNTMKCLREYVNKDVMLVGEFNVSQVAGQQVDYLVTGTKEEVLARNEDIRNGRFSVVTEREELYEICFRSRARSQLSGKSHHVSLITMKGIHANEFTDEMRVELMTIDQSLQLLELSADSVLHEFKVLRDNERKMSSTNESTINRVFYLGIFSVTWLFTTSSIQVLHLYKYFKSKKIIE